jgi:hypothetical protein
MRQFVSFLILHRAIMTLMDSFVFSGFNQSAKEEPVAEGHPLQPAR